MAQQRKTDRQLLDEALAAQGAGTYVDPVQNAKALLSKRSVVDDANAFADSEEAAGREAQKLTPMGTAKRYGKVAKDTAVAAAIPASFLGGPVGMAAGGVLAMDGINSAIKDPSVGNLSMAALGTLPFVKPVRNLMKGAATAKTIKGIRATEGAGDMGAAFSREVPYRAGGGTSHGAPPSMGDLHAEGQVPINWRKPPVTPPTPSSDSQVEQILAALEAQMNAPSKPLHLVPPTPRPAPDFVHPADTTGSAFGFGDLPEISESELTRLQEAFKRLGI